MLYGLEDYAYDEFGLKKKNKFNIKTILLIILVIFACAFLIYIVATIIINNSQTPELKKTPEMTEDEIARLEGVVLEENATQKETLKISKDGKLESY